MNIREAREELKNTVRAYLEKDENGMFLIPPERQRPMLLIGPPGVGKTAIVRQTADELGINLVSYTITHHTRQSAIGLPRIEKRSFDGEEYSVTEYTMSEIIASVYEQIERSGIKEGILFLDEINCVSETLAPTMLQFLQFKTFGTHKVPEGFVIVTAGNPPEYNQSVREFDIVTLDRVRRIDIDADYNAFREYAYMKGVHGAIVAFLEIRKECFYKLKAETDRKSFVTARGWEDLSDALKAYEKLGLPVSEALIAQYIQDAETASDFSVYYELYRKYEHVYRIPGILAGTDSLSGELDSAPFDEKLSLISLLTDALNTEFIDYRNCQKTAEGLVESLNEYRNRLRAASAAEKEGAGAVSPVVILNDIITELASERAALKRANMLEIGRERDSLRLEKALKELTGLMTAENTGCTGSPYGAAYRFASDWFGRKEEERSLKTENTGLHLTNALNAVNSAFPGGQEMVIFLSQLSDGYYSLKFVNECGNDTYYYFNELLLLRKKEDTLRKEALKLKEENFL